MNLADFKITVEYGGDSYTSVVPHVNEKLAEQIRSVIASLVGSYRTLAKDMLNPRPASLRPQTPSPPSAQALRGLRLMREIDDDDDGFGGVRVRGV